MKKILLAVVIITALVLTTIPVNASWYIIQERSNPISWSPAGGGN